MNAKPPELDILSRFFAELRDTTRELTELHGRALNAVKFG